MNEPKEATAVLRLSEVTVRGWNRAGAIEARRLPGGRPQIPAAEIKDVAAGVRLYRRYERAERAKAAQGGGHGSPALVVKRIRRPS